MSASGLASVIIPTFDRAADVLQAGASALAQTYPHLEVLIIDDGSGDDTAARVAAAWGDDPRVRYLQQANAGPAAARNHGLRVATGDYIAFLDSDDVWLPWKLEAQIACLGREPEVGMIWTDLIAVTPDEVVLAGHDIRQRYRAWTGHANDELFARSVLLAEIAPDLPAPAGTRLWVGDVYRAMVAGNLVHTSTALLTRERAEQVGRFDETLLVSGEDFDFHLRTCAAGPVAFLDVASICYRVGAADQLTRPDLHVDIARNFLRTITKAAATAPDPRVPADCWEASMAHARDWYGRELIESGRVGEGRRLLGASLRARFTWGRLGRWLVSLLPGPLRAGLHRVSGRLRASAHRS